MTDQQAIWELEHIYGMVSSEVQKALDVAIKAIKEQSTEQSSDDNKT